MPAKTRTAPNPLAPAPDATPPPVRDRLLIIDDFLPLAMAEAMRTDIDTHFSNPAAHTADVHQVWNYWFVPELYTYLRTAPQKVIAQASVDHFHARLSGWSLETLGLGKVTWPNLSLYVSGCRQGLHNDSANGRFGFVYSLTNNERKTTGGETLVHHEADPFRGKLTRPAAGRSFYDAVAPRFNRLVVFDDRMPHAVERLDGSMDPREGRFVLHGHISESGAVATGALSRQSVAPVVVDAMRRLLGAAGIATDACHGPLTLRLDIEPDGSVGACRVLLDRVIHADAAQAAWAGLTARIVEHLGGLRFPAADGPTRLILPIAFGKSPGSG
jgi:hypothetical protein